MKLTINGKEYGLQWGLGAIELYLDKMDCDLTGLELITTLNKYQPKAILTLVLSALQNYADIHNTPMDVTYSQLQVWTDDVPQKDFDAIIDDWKASKYFGKTIAEHLFGGADEV